MFARTNGSVDREGYVQTGERSRGAVGRPKQGTTISPGKKWCRNKQNAHCVNARSTECGHALIVVKGGVDAVHADGIDTELLEEWNISLASGWERKWVDVICRL